MKLRFPALVSVLLLTSGMALASGQDQPQPVTNDNAAPAPAAAPAAAPAPAAAAPAGAAPSTKCEPAPGAAVVYVPKTREQVHAEAVEAAKKHRSTISQDLDFLKN